MLRILGLMRFLQANDFISGGYGISFVHLKCVCCMTMAVRVLIIRRFVCYYWEQ